ncbi:uncharacterized protein SPPG_09068 [Spizellomyces punctatus DAOM BR117]|uniref:At4g15545-like C-terminal domain-containing protein n=1 Tax=Spizellomyces punctatus (strain DAOM BR117) TaxID=645134 RepID=A0A0L0HMZ5_SPIPD|nr:uncharacterized protein SPPG_09068 [Spizellomyces punctatus DAOM BR117]KND02438.1 hypothetical protein SPPG_09068 [Spizellomyces punctatus DAOM BR117]|eukprot:XP_016610477.1 hypothetical protein SPPG_09068 [Spizellomyces punctatus DAOM BR117]
MATPVRSHSPTRNLGSAFELSKGGDRGGGAKSLGVRPGADVELEKQLKTGLDLIQDAFDRRTSGLSNEVARWKELASNQRQQIMSLEAEISQLNRRVSDLERTVAAQQTEKKSLLASKNVLLDRYTTLKKNAAQLESFRKSIVSMVEYGPATNGINDLDRSFVDNPSTEDSHMGNNVTAGSSGMGGFLPNLPEDVIKEAALELHDSETGTSFLDDKTMRSFDLQGNQSLDFSMSSNPNQSLLSRLHAQPQTARRPGSGQSQQSSRVQLNDWRNVDTQRKAFEDRKSMDKLRLSLRDDATPTPTSARLKLQGSNELNSESSPNLSTNTLDSNRGGFNAPQGSQTPTPQQSSNLTSVFPNANTAPATASIDAPILYKQIRDSLTPSEFEDFAANVALFNAAQQTADQTVRNIGKIVKDRGLFVQMRSLIYTALEESGKGQTVSGEATGKDGEISRK